MPKKRLDVADSGPNNMDGDKDTSYRDDTNVRQSISKRAANRLAEVPQWDNADASNTELGATARGVNASHTNADQHEVESIPSTREVTFIVYIS